jgi:hypothetical protein
MPRRNKKSNNNTNNLLIKPKTPPNSTNANPNSSKASIILKTKSKNSSASKKDTSIATNKSERPTKRKLSNKMVSSTSRTNVKPEKCPSTEPSSTKTYPNKMSKS